MKLCDLLSYRCTGRRDLVNGKQEPGLNTYRLLSILAVV